MEYRRWSVEFVQRDIALSEAQRLIHTRGRGNAVFSCQTSTYVDAVLLVAPGSLPQHTAGELMGFYPQMWIQNWAHSPPFPLEVGPLESS